MPYAFTDRVDGGVISASHVNELQAALESSGPVLRVAANDATQAWKDWSHYVCDGTADQVQLQAAHDALPAAGGRIELSPGTFTLSGEVALTKKLTLTGQGALTVIALANGVNAYAFRFAQVSGDLSGLVFRDFRLTLNGTNQTAGGGFNAIGAIYCTWERVGFLIPHTTGILLTDQPGGAYGFQNTIFDCLFDQGEQSPGNGQGVRMTANDENLLINCRFQYMGGGGAQASAIRDEAGLQLIDNCVFVRGKTGIRIQDTNNTRVSNCTFDACDNHGILVTNGRHLITNNHLSSIGGATANTYSCLYLESNANQCVVSGNVFVPHGTAGKTRSLLREGGNGAHSIVGNVFAVLEGTCGTAYVERNTGGSSGLSVYQANKGYANEGAGTATATAAATLVVTHGLAVTPTQVLLTPTTAPGAITWYVSAKTSTTFTVTLSGTTTITFDWWAHAGAMP